jgi:hypothetical protein
MRFLDAFKAAPLVWPDCGGACEVYTPDRFGAASRADS